MTGIETALLIGGTLVSAMGAIQQGNAAAAAADYNARLAEQNATIATQQAAEKERQQRILARKQIGSARAAYGASGVTMEGSPLDVLEESAYNSELDALTLRYGGQIESMGLRNQAALERMQGKSAKTAGYMNAGSSLLLGGAKAYGSYAAGK